MPLYDAGHVQDEVNLSLLLVSSALSVAVLAYAALQVLRSRAEIRQWPYGAKLYKEECEKDALRADDAITSNHSPQQAAQLERESSAETANPAVASVETTGSEVADQDFMDSGSEESDGNAKDTEVGLTALIGPL